MIGGLKIAGFAPAAAWLAGTVWLHATPPEQQVGLDQLLETAGRYVREYERSFSAVVSREHYVQRVVSPDAPGARELRSEVALVAVDDAEWLMFRDVFEVDGRSVHDRQDRLEALFLKPTAELARHARRIAEESARYNLGDVTRTLNTPTLPLAFLRLENQNRSTFQLGGRRTIDNVETQELRFQEVGMPRLIFTSDNVAAAGSAWVVPASGAIVRTELRLISAGATAAITVTYARPDTPAIWVPVEMNERYEVGRSGVGGVTDIPAIDRVRGSSRVSIEGRARYSDFRQFVVDTKTIIR